MADSSIALDELLDLKMLPAWANEDAVERYAHVEGEEPIERRGEASEKRRERRTSEAQHRMSKADRRDRRRQGQLERRGQSRAVFPKGVKRDHQVPRVEQAVPQIAVRFLPRAGVLENLAVQIKERPIAYSLFALARLFLAKPERYEVRLTALGDKQLFRLGEDGAVAADREFLERNAFRLVQNDFYRAEVTQSEPIKGNFTTVARDRWSGTILGPTNHHDYQKHLRALYEQRFSRRMSFADYQRQIEIVSDPQLVEKWKEDARKIVTYTTLSDQIPVTFSSTAEVERHFREKYLAKLIRAEAEVTINGVSSRRLPERALYRLVEKEWTRETKSPSRMMQELTTRFRQAGLHVFRHRRGMLFVSSIRPRALIQRDVAVSPSVKAIVETLASHQEINRRELADKLLTSLKDEELERAKLALAADLHWLISEGRVIEFNDGVLDLPRVKAKQEQKESVEETEAAPKFEAGVEAALEDSTPDVVPAHLTESPVEVAAIDPIVHGRLSEPSLPDEIGGS